MIFKTLHLINWNKDFIGKDATQTIRKEGVQQKLITLTIEAEGIDANNDEAILESGEPVGYISYSEFGHRLLKAMAMGYVFTKSAEIGTELQFEILGKFYEAKVLSEPIYDPTGTGIRHWNKIKRPK